MPIACGERLTTKAEFATLLRAGGVGIVQPSLGRVGGLLEARKVAVMAEGFGAQVAPHLYAGPIAWAAAVQLGLSIPNFLILETIGTGGGFHAELLKRPHPLGGRLRAAAGGAGARGGDRRGGGAGAPVGGRPAAPGDEPRAARAGRAALRGGAEPPLKTSASKDLRQDRLDAHFDAQRRHNAYASKTSQDRIVKRPARGIQAAGREPGAAKAAVPSSGGRAGAFRLPEAGALPAQPADAAAGGAQAGGDLLPGAVDLRRGGRCRG